MSLFLKSSSSSVSKIAYLLVSSQIFWYRQAYYEQKLQRAAMDLYNVFSLFLISYNLTSCLRPFMSTEMSHDY